MHFERIPNRGRKPTILIRQSRWEDGRAKKTTLANLTHLPDWLVDRIEALVRGKGKITAEDLRDSLGAVRARPHGHVAAALGTARQLNLPRIMGRAATRERALALALLVARVLDPRSKLATYRGLRGDVLSDSLGEVLGVGDLGPKELYGALDWLRGRQRAIERQLAKAHLDEGSLVLCDLTSTYFEGRKCPLAKHGYSRDGKRGKLQVVFSLLCNSEGCPVAVEVFEGNTSDPDTVDAQITKLRKHWSLSHVVMVGDRGMLTEARIRETVQPAGYGWVSALRGPTISGLVESGAIQLSLFDETNLAEVHDPVNYPGERLVVCRNPDRAQARKAKREKQLRATERKLDKVVAAVRRKRSPLRGKAEIGLRVGRAIGKHDPLQFFRVEIGDDSLTYQRDAARIAHEAVRDGLYVIRTSVPKDDLGAADAVRTYKRLSRVERAFRTIKGTSLQVRPVYHRLPNRVRGHVFLCMLAYHVQWHMRRRLAPMLFANDTPVDERATSPVDPAPIPPAVKAKTGTQRQADGKPVHSYETLMRDLATIVRNSVHIKGVGDLTFDFLSDPTDIQAKAFELLGVSLKPVQ